MNRKVIVNYIFTALYQIANIVMSLAIVPYTYAHLTPQVLGISDYAGSIMNWFILFGCLGVNTYGSREIAKVRENKDDLNRTFFEILWMLIIDMSIAMACFYVFIFFSVKENAWIYQLTGITMIASALDITWVFNGLEDFKKISLKNIFIKFLGIAGIMLLCKTPEDIGKYVLINACTLIFGQLIMFYQLRKYIKFTKVSLKKAYQKHFFATIRLFIPTIALCVYTMLDQTMIGALYSEEHLTYYKTANGFINQFLNFITAIGTVMLPRVTNVFFNQKDGTSKAESLIQTTMKIAMMLALPMCFGMIAIVPGFIQWYLPESPIVGNIIMLVSPIIVFMSLSNVTGQQYMIPVGMFNQYTASIVSGAVVNFLINMFMIPRYGAYGAVVGSIVAEVTVTAIQYYFVQKEISIGFKNRSYFIYLLGSIAMAAVVLLGQRFMPATMIGTLILILCGMAVYALVLIVSKEEMLYRIVRKAKNRRAAA